MYKVFANRLPIILTSKNKYLISKNGFLLSSLDIDEILKKVRKYKKIYLYYPKKKKLLKEFKNKIKTIHASGGIVNNKKNQILFIFRRGKWDLPKGKAEIGETKRQTALREVKEETGVKELVINGFFKTTFHLVRNNGKYFLKETNWYLMNSKYDGKLFPQLEEGIKSVKWKNVKQINKIKEKTFKNISIILNDYLKEFHK
jgi:ADP-ribose pyrophosphatase YjhB (NUDIX family)|tara:strand:+ start:25995 stop:26597 length:603 start_codon:yes stop_codon:yes gene_type:complete